MLLEDFGDAFVGEMAHEQWEGALDTLLTVQRGSIPHVGSLLRAGFVDRRPAVLEMQIEDLAEGRLGEVPEDTVQRLRAEAVSRERLRDRYLDGWSDLMPYPEAVELFERTEPAAAMHHAISYQAVIQALDPSERWEWISHLPWWLTRALAGL